MTESTQFSVVAKIINSGIAGIIGITCVFPLDLVKTRLQNQKVSRQGERMYKNMFDCFQKIYKTEGGFLGLYRGSVVNILLITPERAFKLMCNDFFRSKFSAANNELTLPYQMLAGGLAGAFQIVATTPMELLKVRMQDAGRVEQEIKKAGGKLKKQTAFGITQKFWNERGIFGFYRGAAATALRDVTFSVIYFPLFATLNDRCSRSEVDSNKAEFWCSLLARLTAGCMCGFLVTPLDVVKTRLQIKGHIDYRGISDCVRKTLKTEGPLTLFKGGLCRVMVIATMFGIVHMVYYWGIGEAIVNYFDIILKS